MNCKKAEKKFSAYLENELDSKTTRKLEQHLEECESCAYEWRAFQSTLRMVKNMPAIAPSSYFDWQLRLRLAIENSDKVSPERRLFGYLSSHPAFAFNGALAILLVLSVGLYFYISQSEISTSNEFLVRYVMPEISPKEPIEQWSDFNSEAEERLSELYSPQLKDLAEPSNTTDFMAGPRAKRRDERRLIIGNSRPRSSIRSVVSSRYVLRTVSFTDNSVNNPF